jgi:hypothetical protein
MSNDTEQAPTMPGKCPQHGEQVYRWDAQAEFYFCPECLAQFDQLRSHA